MRPAAALIAEHARLRKVAFAVLREPLRAALGVPLDTPPAKDDDAHRPDHQ